MKCDFDYCIYNENFNCMLDKIEINVFGQCETCTIVSFPLNELNKYKKEQFIKIFKKHKTLNDK